jgi:hypothetical protein
MQLGGTVARDFHRSWYSYLEAGSNSTEPSESWPIAKLFLSTYRWYQPEKWY